MKKHELLQKAMKDYPSGTTAKSTWSGDKFKSTGVFKINGNDVVAIDSGGNEYIVFEHDKGVWAEILPESLLSGKCAIQVNNEREFKLLMEHYESKEWKCIGSMKCDEYTRNGVISVTYHDKFHYHGKHTVKGNELHNTGYKIIPFQDFAAEVGIQVPVFVMTSEDGVPLYDGDDAYSVDRNTFKILSNGNSVYDIGCTRHLKQFAFFSTKEAAEAWIKEANNKDITLSLNSFLSVTINGQGITINNTGTKMKQLLFNSELTQIIESYNKYRNGCC